MFTKDLKIAPSILAADFGRFKEEVQQVVAAGADWIHVDVMDGHFVPPITFGPGVVRAIKEVSSSIADVHLMIENPENQLKSFAEAGADIITVHIEACPHLHRTIQAIHELGLRAGVALNPGTSIASVEAILPEIDLLLVMTVNPGWGGQKFIASSTKKISAANDFIKKCGRDIFLEVDGGIDEETAPLVKKCGANVLVAGTHIFKSKDYSSAIKQLR